jgi:hypothetical protein
MQTVRYTYCWEGAVVADFTLDAVRRRYAALADLLNARGWRCLVACDTRFLSAQIAADCYRGLRALGAQVSLSATPLPRPAVDVALDQHVADCALIVSAGNREYWLNGLILIAPAPGLNPFIDGASPSEWSTFPSDSAGRKPYRCAPRLYRQPARCDRCRTGASDITDHFCGCNER